MSRESQHLEVRAFSCLRAKDPLSDQLGWESLHSLITIMPKQLVVRSVLAFKV